MKEEATRKTLKARVVYQAPDVCLTPSGPSMVPVPYPIVGQFSDSMATTPTVKMTNEESFNLGSKIGTVIGDEAGVGGGVISGVNKNVCEYLTFSPTVFAEGKNVVRHDDIMWMNNRNTIGKVLFPIGLQANVVAPSADAYNPPFAPTPQEKSWLDQLGEKFDELDSKYKLINRGVGIVQVIGGAGEMLVGGELLVASGLGEVFSGGIATPVAIPTAIVGGVAVAHGADTASAGLQSIWTGQIQTTNTQKAATWAAEQAGVSSENAKAFGSGVDLAVGLLGPGTQLAKGLAAAAAKRAAMKEAQALAAKESAELVEKQTVDAATKGVATGGTAVTKAGASRAELLSELAEKGVKHTPENVLGIVKKADGKIVFIEKGNAKAGLQHIVDGHAADFARRGVSEAEIPNLIMKAVSEGTPVGTTGAGKNLRTVYEVMHNGQVQKIAVGESSNGFVVTAHPF